MKRIQFIFVVIVGYLLATCNHASKPLSPTSYMCFENIEYVKKFPQSFSLDNAVEESMDIIGIQSFRIHDSMMILSTSNKDSLWLFVSLPKYRVLGKALTHGQGPNEFIFSPSVCQATIREENRQLIAYINSSGNKKLIKLNITHTSENQEQEISSINIELPDPLFNFSMINETKFLCKTINNDATMQLRYIFENDSIGTPTFLERLNQAKISKDEDINILSTITRYNSSNQMVVETPIGLNYINMYKPDGTFSKTICMGDKLNSIEQIEATHRWDRLFTFEDLRFYEKFWGVLYINETAKDYQLGRKNRPIIYLFDWTGSPIAELKLKEPATSFDINMNRGELLTLDNQTDRFFKYDISEIFSKLKK